MEKERVELHCHSKYSDMDGISSPEDIVSFVDENGMSAVAITDHGNINAFSDFYNATSRNDFKVKPIYGMEAYVINDFEKVIYNYKGQDCSNFVAVDVETTGLSPSIDSITEIGAVKVVDGIVVDTFSTFVNPAKPIPQFVKKLTGITDVMVADAPDIKNALGLLMEFANDYVLIAHNANFDISFLSVAANENNILFEPTYIDTVTLSRFVYPNLRSRTLSKLCGDLDIEVGNCHRAFDDAVTCSKLYLNMLERLNENGIPISQVDELMNTSHLKNAPTFHSSILVRDFEGKKILDDLIASSKKYEMKNNAIMFKSLLDNREHLLLGSGCDCGLLFRAVIQGKTDKEIESIASRYDYIEVQPHTNNKYLIDSDNYPNITNEQDLIEINRKIIAIGDKLGVLVVATGDVHYIYEEDKEKRNLLKEEIGYTEDDTDLHFRSTKEMLDAFSYLDKEKAEEIVITNSNKIADMCQAVNMNTI